MERSLFFYFPNCLLICMYSCLGWGGMWASLFEMKSSLFGLRPRFPVIFFMWQKPCHSRRWSVIHHIPRAAGLGQSSWRSWGYLSWSQKHSPFPSALVRKDGTSTSASPPFSVVATISSGDSSGLPRFHSLIWCSHEGWVVRFCHTGEYWGESFLSSTLGKLSWGIPPHPHPHHEPCMMFSNTSSFMLEACQNNFSFKFHRNILDFNQSERWLWQENHSWQQIND